MHIRLMKIWSYSKNNNVLYIIESDCGRQNSPPKMSTS